MYACDPRADAVKKDVVTDEQGTLRLTGGVRPFTGALRPLRRSHRHPRSGVEMTRRQQAALKEPGASSWAAGAPAPVGPDPRTRAAGW